MIFMDPAKPSYLDNVEEEQQWEKAGGFIYDGYAGSTPKKRGF